MKVELFKKQGTYTDKKDNKEKQFTNFYVKCGDKLIPVEPVFFPNPALDGRDPGYSGRKSVLEAFAETLPDRPSEERGGANASGNGGASGNFPQ